MGRDILEWAVWRSCLDAWTFGSSKTFISFCGHYTIIGLFTLRYVHKRPTIVYCAGMFRCSNVHAPKLLRHNVLDSDLEATKASILL